MIKKKVKEQVTERTDMRGLFYIVKGQYRNDKSDDGLCISGYDPESEDTKEWYQVRDRITFHCVACGSTLEKALRAVKGVIIKSKGDAKTYFKHVCSVTSEDYYETHYLGKRPLDEKGLANKQEGRCPRVSPATKELEKKVYSAYGDYYIDKIEDMEEEAYEYLKGQTPFNKAKKLVKKIATPPTPEVIETPKKKLVKKVEEELSATSMKKALVKKPLKKLKL